LLDEQRKKDEEMRLFEEEEALSTFRLANEMKIREEQENAKEAARLLY
jgi:hypothetical protein